jgi:acetyl esterase/lipase
MVLDVWQPENSTAGPFPIVMTVHGGAFVSGNQEDKDPPNAYFASRGFVAFAVQYRLAKDKGLYPKALRRWSAKNAFPHAQWTPFPQTMYPAVRDIKAALRWIHAHASEYNGDNSSITLQGGSAGATAVIELALTGGDSIFADDYTAELQGQDRTLTTANLDQPATATGLIDYWGAIFTVDLMRWKDNKTRWSASSLPTIAFHGTDDTTVSPATGVVLCGNLSAQGVPCKLVSLPGQKHGCWGAKVALANGTSVGIFDYAFDWMASTLDWTIIDGPPVPYIGHYGDPTAGGCNADEKVTTITGIAGDFCSPSCASDGSCPTDVPTGVTASPKCALPTALSGLLTALQESADGPTSDDQKLVYTHCALVCDPAADKANCGPNGNGLSCKGTQAGTGYCTYNDPPPTPPPTPPTPVIPTPSPPTPPPTPPSPPSPTPGPPTPEPGPCKKAWNPCTATSDCCGSCTCSGSSCHLPHPAQAAVANSAFAVCSAEAIIRSPERREAHVHLDPWI